MSRYVAEMVASPIIAVVVTLAIVAFEPRGVSRRGALSASLDPCAAGGLLAEHTGGPREPAPHRRPPGRAPAGGAQDLALLRDLRDRGGCLAGAGQLSGSRRCTGARAPDLADQYRHEPALDARRTRSRLRVDRDPRAPPRRDVDHARRPGALQGTFPELVRHRHPRALAPEVRIDASTAAISLER